MVHIVINSGIKPLMFSMLDAGIVRRHTFKEDAGIIIVSLIPVDSGIK